jgi:hypothetical protein
VDECVRHTRALVRLLFISRAQAQAPINFAKLFWQPKLNWISPMHAARRVSEPSNVIKNNCHTLNCKLIGLDTAQRGLQCFDSSVGFVIIKIQV